MFRGERVELNLDGDNEQDISAGSEPLQGAFVGDILERKTPTAVKAPAAPSLKSKTGFPEHRTRNVESRFKQRNTTKQKPQETLSPQPDTSSQDESSISQTTPSSGKAKTWEEEEKERIDLENRQKLAQMSPEEIEAERRELMNSLSPAFVQRLLQRSNIDSGSAEADLPTSGLEPGSKPEKKPKTGVTKSVSFAEPTAEDTRSESEARPGFDEDNDNLEAPHAGSLLQGTIHFPQPQQPPDLDPSSTTFLSDLHTKYFPSLPSEPEKLEWMQSNGNAKSSYDPSALGLDPKDIRFNFKGELIPPRTAAEISVTQGLHHHGDAPEAAGYTIAELAHLAHSSFAAQRCVAFQTLGRILFRLGKGEFGNEGEHAIPQPDANGDEDEEDGFGELARGLWREIEKHGVIEGLVKESEGKGVDGGRHVSARAYATEAVWLWQRGGGRRWKAE